MSTPKAHRGADADSVSDPSQAPGLDGTPSGAPPTYATFSPVTLAATTPSRSSRRSTIIVHQKSPLLLATPPQITRALAYSHPFLLPLNKLAGLLTWTTDDPWESFLLLASFWAVVLYGDTVVRVAGPIVLVLTLILGMYGRRFSPLSSSGWTEPASKDGAAAQNTAGGNVGKGQKGTPKSTANSNTAKGHHRGESEATNTRHQKTLDEIVETLKEFTGRCNVLLEPLLELTDFLSTQRTPTSATTRPALTTLFVRILFCTPIWAALTLPPLRIITTRRVALLFGTLVLTWHARVMRVARTLLWRSATVRRTAALVTGLTFEKPVKAVPVEITAEADGGKVQAKRPATSELTKALRKQSHKHGNNATSKDAGVKFTFIIYENQRRWVGLGWTQSMFAYERSAWTDEHNNPVPSRDTFELPEVEDGSNMRWRWVDGSKWRVDGVPDDGTDPVDYDGEAGKNGWIYYDNKWQNGRRGADGWGRWTRRRKWYRDAELVEVSEDEMAHELDASQAPNPPRPGSPTTNPPGPALTTQRYSTLEEKMVSPTHSAQDLALSDKDLEREKDDAASTLSTSSGGRSFFKAPSLRRKVTDKSVAGKADKEQDRSRRASEAKSEEEASALGLKLNLALQGKDGGQWGIGDEARMSLE
ncbi:integral peroxisomal membrane peroxin [Colletotrichum tofieldiae]|uniref:Integral peroxisomal membrane peroxin n=1 Tax=Colletotrichum tofieldiae TaxID=708197 RepID=A0A166P185_9PEZI|nr:integral peroxisomal membrane peroxin [Colletotrichum tofieldiae]GKT65394.1 integral peroxisomal membrane peroxin [Colletotrichum tofieldiae]GKT71419.1 integral peroxisomal membrane peroxin [Colletotrichum tofieldiae]